MLRSLLIQKLIKKQKMKPQTKNIRTKRIKKRPWSKIETKSLVDLVTSVGENWTRISKLMTKRNPKQCMQKYYHLVKVKRKGFWSSSEDKKVRDWVEVHGPRKWKVCAMRVEGRCGMQCRERWMSFLDPKLKKGKWTNRENDQLFKMIKKEGCYWAEISRKIERRSENSIKNYFFSSIRSVKLSYIFRILKIFISPSDYIQEGS